MTKAHSKKTSIVDKLVGSILLNDPKLIDDIVESEDIYG